jgi:DNA invertase Pin-like site-specific DNA recombinase
MRASASAIVYLRVSTDRQAESGLGLAAQRASIHTTAQRLGLSVTRVFEDAGTSGSLAIEDRPVLLDAVAMLKRGDTLIVAKRDRLGRDVIAVAMIERLVSKRGARIVSAAGEGSDSDDPAGVLMRRIVDSFAEYERALIAARTRAALAAKRRRCERISGLIPFGFRLGEDGRTLLAHDGEQAILCLIRDRRAAGCSLRVLSEELNRGGLRTRAGTPFGFQYVGKLARRAA